MSENLPEELLIEILVRVPVKSLICFTLVSKSWHALITSPNFIAIHLNKIHQEKIPNNPSLLFIRRYNKDDRKERYTINPDDEEEKGVDNGGKQDFARKSIELHFPFKSAIGYFRIVGTCNGLVCLSDDLFGITKPIFLWNPSVRKYVMLPSPTFNHRLPYMFVLGFGVDSSDGYKVVRIVYHKEGQFGFRLPPEVEVYSLSIGFWRRITSAGIKVYIADFSWSQAFVNGAVHWIAYRRLGNDNGGSFGSLILRFDMENEVFSEIMLPDELSRVLATNLSITVYSGFLAVIQYHRPEDNGACFIWVMKEYGVLESWTRLFAIDLEESLEKIAGFMKNGNVLVAKGSQELAMFDPKTSMIENIGVSGSPRSFYIYNFEETLVLLERQNISGEEEQETEDDHDFQEIGGNDCDGESSRNKNDSHGHQRIMDDMGQLSFF